jgi:hypothetical protein
MKSRSSCFSMVSLVFLFFLSLASFATGVAPAKNRNRAKPGQFVVGDPTLICLGFEWSIDGDDNHNADVGLETGIKNLIGSSGLTVKRCRFENVCMAIWGTYQASKNYYIAVSVLIAMTVERRRRSSLEFAFPQSNCDLKICVTKKRA